MKKSDFNDAFKVKREQEGVGKMDDQNDPVTMILRHKDVRKCAHNWQTFRSGAKPGRIVVPSEEHIRSTRQIPFEVDPPLHKVYRATLEDWFRRPYAADYEAELYEIAKQVLAKVADKDRFDVVSEFALVLQSKALSLLLNVPEEQAETWISWGKHVFRSEDNPLDGDKAKILYNYIDEQIEKAIQDPGEDLYSVLLNSEIEGRKYTKEEVRGVLILTFAGGRDTIINAITNTISYLGDRPESFDILKRKPEMIGNALEELFRYFSPLTHMGRVVAEDTSVCEHAVKSDSRISLCWASANRDENVFENPNEVVLDRKINPHLAFGFGIHKCLGASHARQVLRVLMRVLIEEVQTIELLEAEENIEEWGDFKRKVGFDALIARFKRV